MRAYGQTKSGRKRSDTGEDIGSNRYVPTITTNHKRVRKRRTCDRCGKTKDINKFSFNSTVCSVCRAKSRKTSQSKKRLR